MHSRSSVSSRSLITQEKLGLCNRSLLLISSISMRFQDFRIRFAGKNNLHNELHGSLCLQVDPRYCLIALRRASIASKSCLQPATLHPDHARAGDKRGMHLLVTRLSRAEFSALGTRQ